MSRRKFYINTKKFPKATLKPGWKLRKTLKWRYQSEDNYRDGITDMIENFYSSQRYKAGLGKEYRKMVKRLKHLLYFNIPFTNEDKEYIKTFLGSYALKQAEENYKRLKERDKNEKES